MERDYLEIIREHRAWRLGEDGPTFDLSYISNDLTLAIDALISEMEAARRGEEVGRRNWEPDPWRADRDEMLDPETAGDPGRY